MDRYLRKRIVEMITNGGEGHIPSSFSVIDIINNIYSNHLIFDNNYPEWPERDFFVLSKGHAGAALFVVFFQKMPVKNTANIPGLTTPVYS